MVIALGDNFLHQLCTDSFISVSLIYYDAVKISPVTSDLTQIGRTMFQADLHSISKPPSGILASRGTMTTL